MKTGHWQNLVPKAEQERIRVHMNVVSLLSLRRDPPPESSPTFSVQSRSSVGRLTVDLIGRSWSSISQDFFFASCGSLIPFTWANAQWVIHGFIQHFNLHFIVNSLFHHEQERTLGTRLGSLVDNEANVEIGKQACRN